MPSSHPDSERVAHTPAKAVMSNWKESLQRSRLTRVAAILIGLAERAEQSELAPEDALEPENNYPSGGPSCDGSEQL